MTRLSFVARMCHWILFAVVALVGAIRLPAQATDALSLDARIGANRGYGSRQPYDNASGVAGEVVLAVRFHPDGAVTPIAALSLGGEGSLGGHEAVCVVLPPPVTGCEPQFPSFAHLGLLGGVEVRRRGAAVRAVIGPAAYKAGGESGLGGQIDLDGAVGFAHVALVAAVRGSLVGRFNGDRLWCRSLELGVRVQ